MNITNIAAVLLATSISGFAATTQINAINSTGTLVYDNSGTALSFGSTAATLGDGDLYEIGYFSTDTSSFSGTWIAITGVESNNATLVTSIGDLPDGVHLDLAGVFSSKNIFDDGVANTANDIPANGTQLALRFYDAQASAGAMFNTVTDPNWTWTTPKEITTPSDIISMSVLDGNTNGTLVWQDSANAFKTSLVVPEPSSTALLGLGGLAFFIRRRR